MSKSRRFSFMTFSALGDGSTSETAIYPRPASRRLSTGPTGAPQTKQKKRMSLPASFSTPTGPQEDRCASRSSSLAVTVGAPSPPPSPPPQPVEPVLAALDAYTTTSDSRTALSHSHARRLSLSRSLSVTARDSLSLTTCPPSQRAHAPGLDAWIAQQRALASRGAYDVGTPISIHGDVALPISASDTSAGSRVYSHSPPHPASQANSHASTDHHAQQTRQGRQGRWTRLLAKRAKPKPKHTPEQSSAKPIFATHERARPPSSYVDTDTGYASSSTAPTAAAAAAWATEYHAVDGPEGASGPTGRWRGENWVGSSTLGRAGNQTPSGTDDSARCDSGCAPIDPDSESHHSYATSGAYISDMDAAHEWMNRQDFPAGRCGLPAEREQCHLHKTGDGVEVHHARGDHARWEHEQERVGETRLPVDRRNLASNPLPARCWSRNRVVLDRERGIKTQRIDQAWEHNRSFKPQWAEGKRFAELYAGNAETGTGTSSGTAIGGDAPDNVKVAGTQSPTGTAIYSAPSKPAPSAFTPRRSRASAHRYSLDNSRPPAQHIFAGLWPFRRDAKKAGEESSAVDQNGTAKHIDKENAAPETDEHKPKWKRFSSPPISNAIKNVTPDGPVRTPNGVHRYGPSPTPSWPSSLSQSSSTPPSASPLPSHGTSPAPSSPAPSIDAQPGSPRPIASAWPQTDPESVIKQYLNINKEEYDAKVVAQWLHDDVGFTDGEDPGVRSLTIEETTAFPWHVVLNNPPGNESSNGQLFLNLRGISYALPDLSIRGAHLNRQEMSWETLKSARVVDTWGNVLNLVALSKHLTAVRVVRLVLRGLAAPLSLNVRCESLITFTHVPWAQDKTSENGGPIDAYHPCTVEVGPVPSGVRRLVISVMFDDRSPGMKIARFPRIPVPATLAETVIIFQPSVYLNSPPGAATTKLRLTRTPLIDSLFTNIIYALGGTRISLVGAELLSGTNAADAQRAYHHTLAEYGISDAAARLRVVSHSEYKAEVGRHVYALETDTSG